MWDREKRKKNVIRIEQKEWKKNWFLLPWWLYNSLFPPSFTRKHTLLPCTHICIFYYLVTFHIFHVIIMSNIIKYMWACISKLIYIIKKQKTKKNMKKTSYDIEKLLLRFWITLLNILNTYIHVTFYSFLARYFTRL